MHSAPIGAPDEVDTKIVMTSLMRATGGSGPQSHVRTFRDYLHASSRQESLVNPFSSKSPLLRPIFGARIGIRLVSKSASVWWYRHWHAYFLRRALADHLADRSPCVIYAHCPVSADVALRERTDQPVVMAAHLNVSQADEWAEKGEIAWCGTLFRSIRSFEERVLGELDGIVYVSAFTRRVLEQRIPRIRNVPGIVIPNPVAVTMPASWPEPTADLITVGTLEPRKNHGYLLQVLDAAARRGYRYTLTVVGDGPGQRALGALTHDLGLSDQVRFVGYQAEPRRFLRDHRLYCHTATMESFGIALVEAMGEGLPVIAGAVGGVPEVFRPGREGVFWPLDDPASAASVLIELMEDEPRRSRMAAAARTRALTEFSADVVGRRLLSFLDTFSSHPSRETLT